MTASRDLSYEAIGATEPGADVWTRFPAGFRRFERTVALGEGDQLWSFARSEVMQWGVKRRSGFRVSPRDAVENGNDYAIVAGVGPLTVTEPVRVVSLVDSIDRCGFSYGTLHGHPVAGEEAFIVHRNEANVVFLTLRSLTRPAPRGVWRLAFPLLLLAQRYIRRRYLRVLAVS